MSKSYTACVDRNLDCNDSANDNLTRSLNSTITNDNVIKSLKTLPLQTISTEQTFDNRGLVLRKLDSTDDNNVTITVSGPHDIAENLSLPSSSSSAMHTPEATTPTNISKNEEGSPIIRGLKSVFNMFRSSQSPIPPAENDISIDYEEKAAVASTPISAQRSRDNTSSKRNSPLKESIVFNDDLEKELQWKDETILFNGEKVPIHKLFFQQTNSTPVVTSATSQNDQKPADSLNSTVEYMDISYNKSMMDKTLTETHTNAGESDGEFVDCETTFSKNESQNIELAEQHLKDPLSITLGTLDISKEIANEIEYIPNLSDENTTKHELKIELPKSLDITEIVEEHIPVVEGVKKQNPALAIPTLDVTREIVAENVANQYENIVNNGNQEVSLTGAEKTSDITSEIIVSHEVNKNLESKNELQKDSAPEPLEVTKKALDEENNTLNVINESEIPELTTPPTDNNVSIASPMRMETPHFEQSESKLEHNVLLLECLQDEKIKDSFVVENQFDVKEHQTDITFELSKDVSTPENINLQIFANESIIINESEIGITDIQSISLEHDYLPATIEENKEIHIESEDNESQNFDKANIVSEVSIKTQNFAPKTDLAQDPVACPPKNTSNDTMNKLLPALEKEIKTEEQTKPTDSDAKINENILSAPSLLEEEPANIPLPDDDDIDSEENVEVTNVESETIQALCPDVLDTSAIQTKLDETETLDKTISETMQVNIYNDEIKHKTPILGNDLLNETNDIVNSLTEIIGESPNTYKSDLDQSRIIEPVDGVECTENPVLPDLLNQAMHNMTIECEIVPQGMNKTQFVANNEPVEVMITAPNVPEIIDVTNVKTVDTSVPEQRKGCNNSNKEHADEIVEIKENIEVVPKEILQVESNELENVQNEMEPVKDAISVTELKKMNDEELIVSENNSPYVFVTTENDIKTIEDNFEIINIPNTTQSDLPSSPPIRSKGYNFNFDEMDDPFATKTNIRLSPPPASCETDNGTKQNSGTSKKNISDRRRLQPSVRKRPVINKKKLNTTFDASSCTHSSNEQALKTDSENVSIDIENDTTTLTNIKKSITKTEESTKILDSTQKLEETMNEKDISKASEEIPEAVISVENKSSVESIMTSEIKTSSSEQSTYYSAAASSSDSSHSKNVFNLPEIDDANFNPFASKSRMRQSPPLDFENENPFATKSKIRSTPDSSMVVLPNEENFIIQNTKLNTPDKMDTELMEKDISNVSNISSSSKGTDDKNLTIHVVNTEDEDTEEGPFLETEDAIEKIMVANKNDDVMQFDEIPPQAVIDDGELFIDAEAFEFLLNKTQHNAVADSGRESLFLKFDPLFSKRISSDGVMDHLAALNKVQKSPSTPTKPIRSSLRNETSPIAEPSNLNATYEGEMKITQESNEDRNVTVPKPMMVVTPAVNPVVIPRNKSITPTRSNRRSTTFTSPAMAVIDSLLLLSGNSSFVGQQDSTTTHMSRVHHEADQNLLRLRELLAEREVSNNQLRCENNELQARLLTMESQVKILEADGQNRLKKINDLNECLVQKNKLNKSMAAAIEEYERTIAYLVAEKEQDKKLHAEERITLINERDEEMAHLTSMEVTFNDLHSKYEKSKQVILSYKANEDICKKSMNDLEETYMKMQNNYELLKQHATLKLNHANQELQKINKANKTEVLKLNAMIKRKDMGITTLKETLAQKTKANEELTAICDDLINKVG